MLEIIYFAGIFHGSTAPIAITVDPDAYTIDKYKIVLNFPHQESAIIAPKMQKKYTRQLNVWYKTVAVSSS